jgi:HK97 family phage prohead protease
MLERLETKSILDLSSDGTITGLAWVWDSPDRTGDIIERGAVSYPDKLPLLWQHDQSQPIGIWNSFESTDKGFEVTGRLLVQEIAKAAEARALIQAGAVTGLSIGFQTKAAKPRKGGGRIISALDLLEVSVVSIPAHPGAQITSTKQAAAEDTIAAAIHNTTLSLILKGFHYGR